jgi:hypothetical protein
MLAPIANVNAWSARPARRFSSRGETVKKFFNPGFIKNAAALAFLLTNIAVEWLAGALGSAPMLINSKI